MRDECLEINDFATLLEARVIIGDWRHALQPRPAEQLTALPGHGGLRCDLHPPAPSSHTAGPVNGGQVTRQHPVQGADGLAFEADAFAA
jgi:hypothetical protein